MGDQHQSFFRDGHERQDGTSSIGNGNNRDHNTDPRELPHLEVVPVVEAFNGYDGPEIFRRRLLLGEKLIPASAIGNHRIWFALIPLLGLGLALGLFAGVWGLLGASDQSEQRIFSVDFHPLLLINDTNGRVNIHAGCRRNTISVMSIKHATGFGANLSTMSVQTNQTENNTVLIDAKDSGMASPSGSRGIDLDVTTPFSTSVEVHLGNGVVNINNIAGDIQISTRNGAIDAHHIEGQAILSTEHGHISVSDSDLFGQSLLRTKEGKIEFVGSIDPAGTYDFETNNGSIDMTLPDTSVFRLHSTAPNNTIHNEFGYSNIGDGYQQADLTINANHGGITINESIRR